VPEVGDTKLNHGWQRVERGALARGVDRVGIDIDRDNFARPL
jgi:hypothetical protein